MSSSTFKYRVRRLAILIACGLTLLSTPLAIVAADDTDLPVRQLWQLLDYVAVDYSGAVANGEVSDATEFQEMREFAATIRERVKSLPAREGQQALVRQSEALDAAVTRHAPSKDVEQLAHGLADQLLATYPIPISPKTPPDLARGAAVYQAQCAACHGAEGRGDGPAAARLDPKPVAFTDVARARERSLLSLYETISQGVPGTSMLSFASLPAEDRWALAFYVGVFAYPPIVRQEGARLWKQDDAVRRRISSLEALSRATEHELAGELGADRARALIGHLRATPAAINPPTGLTLARARIKESVQAYASNDHEGAARLALSAYLDGIEPIEPQLSARDAGLLTRIETAMAEYRARIRSDVPLAGVAEQARVLENLLDAAGTVLDQTKVDAAAAFLASFTILLREGLEALLIVVAIVALLRKAGRQDMMGYVHSGWISALLAGALTWAIASFVVSISGAGRELTEGYSSLFAAFVLLTAGLWMHQKSLAGRWQRYIDERLAQILHGRSAWLLTGLVFVVVYREVFETILFYAALTSEGNGPAILAGLAAGAGVLALIAVALLRYSARLPVGKFFSVSAAFIAILAVVLAGKGAAALQEAGVLAVRTVPFPRVSLLGIFPSVQTLSLQLVVAFAAIAGFIYNAQAARHEQRLQARQTQPVQRRE
jgi:high-affinity iron transporter